MASRLPLVLVAGKIQQLQAADTLNIPSVTAGTVLSQTNDEAGPIVIGTPVYNDANDGVKKALANASGTSPVMGLVRDATIASSASGSILLDGVLTATTAQWDAVFGTTGGLTAGTKYFLSPTVSGTATSTAPSTVGQYVVALGVAISTTELRINIEYPILL